MTYEIGIADRRRILAAIVDNILAFVFAFLAISLFASNYEAANALVLCSAYLLYFLIFEAVWARTPGKMFTGLKVCRLDGRDFGLKEALIRTLLRLIDTNPLLAGGLPAGLAIMFTKKRQRLGDLLAGTIVVPK